jgi:hypothetical protein
MRQILGLLLLCSFLIAGAPAYRAVILPPQTRTVRGLTITLAARADGACIVVTANIRNDSAETFVLRPEQVSLAGPKNTPVRKTGFFWPPVLPDASENLVWRFRANPGEYVLRLLDLEFPLLIKAGRPETPYYLERAAVYDFTGGRLKFRSRGQGVLIVDQEEELLAVWLRLPERFVELTRFDYASWLVTENVLDGYAPEDCAVLLKTKALPQEYQVFDLCGNLLL